MLVAMDPALVREDPAWLPLPWRPPAAPGLVSAAMYVNTRRELAYGDLMCLEAQVWQSHWDNDETGTEEQWQQQVRITVSTGNVQSAVALLPGKRQPSLTASGAKLAAMLDMRDFLAWPSLNGVIWQGEAPSAERVQVRLPPAAQQDLAWLHRHTGEDTDGLVALGLSLLQVLERVHLRGDRVVVERRATCGHTEYGGLAFTSLTAMPPGRGSAQ